VNSNKLWMTAQIPSGFAMPGSGYAFEVDVPATDARRSSTTTVVRECTTAFAGMPGAVKWDLGLAQAHIAGNPAWRPPTC
jgi:hypothetical protein